MAVDGLVDGGVLTFNGIRCGGSRDGCCGSPNNSNLDLIDYQKDETELLHFVRRRETEIFRRSWTRSFDERNRTGRDLRRRRCVRRNKGPILIADSHVQGQTFN